MKDLMRTAGHVGVAVSPVDVATFRSFCDNQEDCLSCPYCYPDGVTDCMDAYIRDIDSHSAEYRRHYFGVVRWCDEDIEAMLIDMGLPTDKETITKVRHFCESNKHFTDTMIEAGWMMIRYAIDEVVQKGEC